VLHQLVHRLEGGVALQTGENLLSLGGPAHLGRLFPLDIRPPLSWEIFGGAVGSGGSEVGVAGGGVADHLDQTGQTGEAVEGGGGDVGPVVICGTQVGDSRQGSGRWRRRRLLQRGGESRPLLAQIQDDFVVTGGGSGAVRPHRICNGAEMYWGTNTRTRRPLSTPLDCVSVEGSEAVMANSYLSRRE